MGAGGVRTWGCERALERMMGERLRRFKDRWGLRREWYEIGFRDGWESAWNNEERTIKEDDMAKKSVSEVKSNPAQRSGNPNRAPKHEGPAGSGSVMRSKFSKEDRDSVGEKEPGKSRGAR
jgi:hypothetical protein